MIRPRLTAARALFRRTVFQNRPTENRPTRGGATLVEVLVAIFVMAIGLLALLVMFPLGAIRMAQAIKDDRTGQMAQNAKAMMSTFNLQQDVWLTGGPGGAVDVLRNPNGFISGTIPPAVQTPFPPATDSEPSYAVLLDPTGFITAAGTPSQVWVGPGLTPAARLLPRRSVSIVGAGPASPRLALRWFAFLDELPFDLDGRPSFSVTSPPAPLNQFDRQYRYSCALLCQRPRTGVPGTVNTSVIVYDKRPLSLSGNADLYESWYGFGDPAGSQVTFDTTQNLVRVQVPAGAPLPEVAVGEWLLDVTPALPGLGNVRHAYFYRIVGITEINATTVDYEVQTPLRDFGPTPGSFAGSGLVTPGPAVVFMQGVAEVFELGTTRP